jgi:hypothetical protein
MGWLLSDEERAALWPTDEVPCGEAARRWQSPEARLERYERALNGILACYPASPAICMLQAVAATALGKDELARDLLFQAERGEHGE